MIMISACLVGINCKYDGTNNFSSRVEDIIAAGMLVPFCPEQLGGFPTPRVPAEIVDGTGCDVLAGRAKVVDKNGKDVTSIFLKGAQESLNLARVINPEKIILKEKSPSCGSEFIYDGTFSGRKIPGGGVTAELLKKQNFKIVSV